MRKPIWMFLFVLLVPVFSFAAIPGSIPYSGQLLEGGNPVQGRHFFTFNVYDAVSGGSAIYTQAESLDVVGGVYHTSLDAPASVWSGDGRWVGVSVDLATEMTPRVQVGWVPYAVRLLHSPILQVRPATVLNVTSTWTRVDSLTIVAPVAGITILNVTGSGLWSGAVSQSSAELSIDEATPTQNLQVIRAISGSDALAVTNMVATSPGTHKFYFWARALAAGQTYSIASQRFQATFIPN